MSLPKRSWFATKRMNEYSESSLGAPAIEFPMLMSEPGIQEEIEMRTLVLWNFILALCF